MNTQTNINEQPRFECKILEHGSSLQQLSLELRYQILREPLGLTFTDQDLYGEDQQVHIAAVHENQVLAVLLLKPNNTTLKMRQVAVQNAFQGKGIGKALVSFSEQWAKAKGYTQIQLHARDTAIPFYLSLNYTLQGDGFSEVGIPHHYMFKWL